MDKMDYLSLWLALIQWAIDDSWSGFVNLIDTHPLVSGFGSDIFARLGTALLGLGIEVLMRTILVTVLCIYLIGACGTFWMHTQMPVTFGLALMRTVLWPIWATTGHPEGQRMETDCSGSDCG